MTLSDELKILGDKVKANQAQYDLGRGAAKISALSSKDLLEKYKYLTGEDLGHRPSVLEQTKFEYSPLGKSLSKWFKKDNMKNIAKSDSENFLSRKKQKRNSKKSELWKRLMSFTKSITMFTKMIITMMS